MTPFTLPNAARKLVTCHPFSSGTPRQASVSWGVRFTNPSLRVFQAHKCSRTPESTNLTSRIRANRSACARKVGIHMGMGQNSATRNRTTGFGPCSHLPGQIIWGLPYFDPAPYWKNTYLQPIGRHWSSGLADLALSLAGAGPLRQHVRCQF